MFPAANLYRPSASRLFPAITLIGCLFVFGGCSEPASDANSQRATSNDRLKIVCTTNIVRDLVEQIGGNEFDVTAIMDGPGVDPHTYTPSPLDTNILTSADIVVYSGLHLEGQFNEVLESLEYRGIPVICLTEDLAHEAEAQLIQTDDGLADPHVWFDPDLWAACGKSLAKQLAGVVPASADSFQANADAYSAQMNETSATGRKLVAKIPRERRVLVTAHDAFAYFARAFEFDVEAVQGISTDSEPGLRRINELIDLLVERRISAVFTEQSVSDKNIQALVEGCKARGHQLTVGARLYSDTAGAAGTAEGSLAGALLYNIRQVSKALSTTVDTAHVEQGGRSE